jgi:hypothetical protein
MNSTVFGFSKEYTHGYESGKSIAHIKHKSGNWVLGGFFLGSTLSLPGVIGSMYLSSGYHKPPKEYYYFEENNEYRLGFEDGYSITSESIQKNEAIGASIFGALITPLIIYGVIMMNKKY